MKKTQFQFGDTEMMQMCHFQYCFLGNCVACIATAFQIDVDEKTVSIFNYLCGKQSINAFG